MEQQLFVYLAFVTIGFCVMYLLIQNAIDNSKTADEMTEIRKLLQKLVENFERPIKTDNEKEIKNYELLNIPYDVCPACGANISQEDGKCPSCGITLG